MTIENQLEEIANRLTDIAHHLARIVDRDAPLDGAALRAFAVDDTPEKTARKAKDKTPDTAPGKAIEKPEPDPAPAQETAAAAKTYDDVKAAIGALSAAKGRDACIAVLQRFGAARAPDLKPEQYGPFVADCARVAAGGEP